MYTQLFYLLATHFGKSIEDGVKLWESNILNKLLSKDNKGWFV